MATTLPLVERIIEIAAIPVGNYLVKNEKLSPAWQEALGHEYFVVQTGTYTTLEGSSSNAASQFLKAVVSNPVLLCMGRLLLRGGIGHCRASVEAIQERDGKALFFQNRINWDWQVTPIVSQFFGRTLYSILSDREREAFDFAVSWGADPEENFCALFHSYVYHKPTFWAPYIATYGDYWTQAKLELIAYAVRPDVLAQRAEKLHAEPKK